METKEIIKNRRQEMGLTMKELADCVGVSEGTISRWEAGKISNMKRNKVALLSRVLGIPLEVIMGWETDADRFAKYADDYNKRNFPYLRPSGIRAYPVLGKIACGKPIIANEEHDVLTTDTPVNADAVLIARGDSMINARILDGDTVFIKFQETVENGQIAAVAIENTDTEDVEVTLKRFFRYGPDIVVLRAENPSYSDMEFHGEEISRLRIIGRAVAFQSEL